jgi:hypothetical protein
MAERRISPKRVFAGVAMLAAIVAVGWFAIGVIGEWRREQLADSYVKEIVARLDLGSTPGFSERLDKVRIFINDHSRHKMDAAFWANHGNPAAFAAGVLAHAKGEAKPVHMECSTRSNLMGRILKELGYETRIIAIFDSHTNLKSHSFIEVLNPDTKQWETQDPDYDIYWRSKISGERVSLAEAAETMDEIEPCGRNACGWYNPSREGHKAENLKAYLDIISITEKEKSARHALYTSRADLARSYRKGSKTGLFCDVEAKRCQGGFYDIRAYKPTGG